MSYMKYNGVGNITREGRACERDPRTYTCSYKNGSSSEATAAAAFLLFLSGVSLRRPSKVLPDSYPSWLHFHAPPNWQDTIASPHPGIVQAVRTKCKCETFCFVEANSIPSIHLRHSLHAVQASVPVGFGEFLPGSTDRRRPKYWMSWQAGTCTRRWWQRWWQLRVRAWMKAMWRHQWGQAWWYEKRGWQKRMAALWRNK